MTGSDPNTASPELRKKYRLLNYLLIAVLALLTCKKALAVIMVGSFNVFNLAGLIVPVINVFFIRLLLLYQKAVTSFSAYSPYLPFFIRRTGSRSSPPSIS